MKTVRVYLAQSVVIVMLSVLVVLGVGLWLSVRLYLGEYLRHLRQMASHHHMPGVVGQSRMGLNVLDHFVRAMALNVAVASMIALVAGWLVALLISRSLTRPLKLLTQGAYAVARGATNIEITSSGLKELEQLATALTKTAQTFRDAEQARRERLEDLSHEIRTPLTALLGYSQSVVAVLPSGVLDPFNMEIERLSRMAERLPDAAPLTSYFYRAEAISAETLLRPVWDLYQPLLDAQVIYPETDWTGDLVFWVDPAAIREALHNLIDNALKFTPKHGTIRLAAEPSDIRGYGVIVVEDSGPGIPAAEENRMLQRTIRLDAKRPGQGLGLAIVDSVVKSHAGSTSLDRSSLGGAAVALTLPLVDNHITWRDET